MKAVVLCALAWGVVLNRNALTQVVKKLGSMMEQSKKDGEDDRTEFAKYKCQCNTDLDDARETLKESTEIIEKESGEVERLRGTNGKVSQEIAALTQQLAENKDQHEKATAERDQQKQDYEENKADLETGTEQLGEAIQTLAEIGADQTSESRDRADSERFLKKDSLVSVKKNLRQSMRAVSNLLPASQRTRITSFIEAPFSGTYTAQSGEIIGILKNMKETFKQDLTTATQQEEKRQIAYDDLTQLLTTDAEDMEKARTAKKAELGEDSAEVKIKKKNIADNERIKADAEETIATRTEQYNEKTAKYEGRRATRANEEAALSKAIAILNSDAAFENKSFKSGGGEGLTFVQIRKHMQEDPFAAVLVEIEKMQTAIDKEAEGDATKKKWCESENTSNEEKLTAAKDGQDQEQAKIALTEEDVSTAKGNLETAQSAIKKLQDHNQVLLETRKASNKQYQALIAEFRDAHDILAKAVKVLINFYQGEPTTKSEEEHEFTGQAGGEVISLLEDIQKNTQDQDDQAHADEEEDQGFFETEMAENAQSLVDEKKNVATQMENIADGEERLLAAKLELNHQQHLEEEIEAYKKSIFPGCDFLLANFALREKNRTTERGQLEMLNGKIKERQAAHGK
eukprot:GEMP01024568.1.p1 GENE.GEMP01024568.1~~GEMP01024568.1.p1  ORF type:complete len:630 (+),score=199.38 GEMP01024568.1:128-2017(+)